MYDELPADENLNPESLHNELGRRRLRLWWLVLALLAGALLLMYLALQLREAESGGKQATSPNNSAAASCSVRLISFDLKSIPVLNLSLTTWN